MLLAPMDSGAAPPDSAARDAAMRQLKRPDGVGGCLYLALPADVRREALFSVLADEGYPPALRAAAADMAGNCTGRPSGSSDLAVVGSLVGAVRRAAVALALATQYGVGQDSLDGAWAAASPEQKASFYEVAEEFLAPDRQVSHRVLEVAGLAAKLGLDAGGAAEPALRRYFLATALSERSEAMLAQGANPTIG